ncbi:MAG: carbohydrate ABC transporter permease, partial [Chloroflexota bacterium]
MATLTASPTQTAVKGGGYIRTRISHWLVMLFLFVFAALTLLPFLWVVSTSLRTPVESFTEPPKWIPTDLAFENYNQVFTQIPFWNQLLNSFIITLSVVAGQVITASLAGYAFARLKFPGRTVLFWVVLATMMIPGMATIIPLFILVSRGLHINDTLWSLIIPSIPTAFGTFLLRQGFQQGDNILKIGD